MILSNCDPAPEKKVRFFWIKRPHPPRPSRSLIGPGLQLIA